MDKDKEQTKAIETMLNQLDDLKATLDNLRNDMQVKRAEIIPQEVRDALDDLEAEYQPAFDAAQAGIAELEAEIKRRVIAYGATVKGDHLQAVWSKGRESVDMKLFKGYAVAHPEAAQFIKVGEPSVSIRNNR